MKIAPVAEVKARLSTYLDMCAQGPVIVTRNGRPTAVLVAVSNEEELERLVLGHTPRFRAILESAERRIQQGKGVRHDDFWTAVMKKHRETAAQPRAKRLAKLSRRVQKESKRINPEFAAIEREAGGARKNRLGVGRSK